MSVPEANPYLLRPTLVAVLVLIAGQVLAVGAAITTWHPAVIVGCLALAIVVALPRQHLARALAVAGVCLAMGLWQQTRLNAHDEAAFETIESIADGGSALAAASGRLETFPRRTAAGWTLQLAPGAVLGVGGRAVEVSAPLILRVPDPRRELWELVPGDQIEALGSLRELPRVAGEGDRAEWLRSRGAVAVLTTTVFTYGGEDARESLHGSGLRLSASTAHAIEEHLRAVLPKDAAAILTAMTLGRTHLLSPEQRRAFQRVGLMHIFAVSGLHTMLVGGMLLFAMRVLGLRLWMRLVLLAIFLFFFAALVGMRASVMRAAFLLMVFEGRELLRRTIDPLAALATIALGMLLWSPRALWQVDFQMSFICALAIVVASPWMIEVQKFVGARMGWGAHSAITTRLAQVFLLSAFIQLMLAPVLIGNFGEVSLIAPVANMLLLVPLSFLLQLGFLLLTLSLAIPAAGEWIALLAGPINLAGDLARWIADLPFAAWESPAWPILFSGLFYTVILSWRLFQHRPVTAPRRGPLQFIPGFAALLALLVWTPFLLRPGGALEVWFLDVGQGDAILVSFPDGTAGLIDAGPPTSAWFLPEMIRARGIVELDFIAATHADIDHIGGMETVLRSIPVQHVYTSGTQSNSADFQAMETARQELNIPETVLRRGDRIKLGRGATIDVLHPTEDFVADDIGRNEASLVLLLEYAGRRILLTGDAEQAAEESMHAAGILAPVDILKAGHHGARESTGSALLNATEPGIAIISCGVANRHGHPAPEVMQRLTARNVDIWRTDQDGTVYLRIDNDGAISIKATRRGRGLVRQGR